MGLVQIVEDRCIVGDLLYHQQAFHSLPFLYFPDTVAYDAESSTGLLANDLDTHVHNGTNDY